MIGFKLELLYIDKNIHQCAGKLRYIDPLKREVTLSRFIFTKIVELIILDFWSKVGRNCVHFSVII